MAQWPRKNKVSLVEHFFKDTYQLLICFKPLHQCLIINSICSFNRVTFGVFLPWQTSQQKDFASVGNEEVESESEVITSYSLGNCPEGTMISE